MITNKKVLIVCKETFSYPMSFIGHDLIEQGNDVSYFFITPPESTYKECPLNRSSYYHIKDKCKYSHFFSVREITEKITYSRGDYEVDYKYLNYVSERYTGCKGLNLQLMSSQYLTRYYHHRDFFPFTDFKFNAYWLELNYRLIESINDEFLFDLVIDLDVAELQRTILYEYCLASGIPYITPEYARFDSYIVPTMTLGNDVDQYFCNLYEEKYSDSLLEEGQKLVLEFRNKDKIMDDLYKNDITSQYKLPPIHKTMLNILRSYKQVIVNDIKNISIRMKARKLSVPLFSTTHKRLMFHTVHALRRWVLYKNIFSYFNTPKEEPYVYMPLHLIPESSTFTKAPYFVNELQIIEAVSKSLPIEWKLYVKEHQSMAGERPLAFYKKATKLHNVKLIKINYYDDPKQLILNSQGVVTITGTSAFEAVMLGKRAVLFGKTFFSVIKGIKVASSFDELPSLFKEMTTDNLDNLSSCSAYIESVFSSGQSINVKDLIQLSYMKINHKEIDEEYFHDMIEKLMSFYSDGLKYYNIDKKEGV